MPEADASLRPTGEEMSGFIEDCRDSATVGLGNKTKPQLRIRLRAPQALTRLQSAVCRRNLRACGQVLIQVADVYYMF